MFGLLRISLKHFFKVFSEEYQRAKRLRVLINLLSVVSGILTFASLFVTIRIPVTVSWLPYLLWGALAICLLLLLMLGFIANYNYHVRLTGELANRLKDQQTEAESERFQKDEWKQTAQRIESEKRGINDALIQSQSTVNNLEQVLRVCQSQLDGTREQLADERAKHAAPDLYGKIKEVYLKSTSNGLYITLRVFIGNRGADTTIQPFVLKFLLNGREHVALEDDDVTDYCILRTIDKPLWPSLTREETYEELKDISEENLTPLERHRHREGWLRFRIPRMSSYMRWEGGELTLEIIDATDRVVPVKACSPWPQDGVIRFTRQLRAEWDEALERTRRRQLEEADSEESAPPNAS